MGGGRSAKREKNCGISPSRELQTNKPFSQVLLTTLLLPVHRNLFQCPYDLFCLKKVSCTWDSSYAAGVIVRPWEEDRGRGGGGGRGGVELL